MRLDEQIQQSTPLRDLLKQLWDCSLYIGEADSSVRQNLNSGGKMTSI
jgi:UTP:GlnB (protein PII) uridylyltransferase